MSKYEKVKPNPDWIFKGPFITGQYVKSNAKKYKHIIIGSHALNAQLPYIYKKPTRDWDVLAKKPHRYAHMLENQLDTYFKSDVVDVKPAFHKGTYRVLANMGPKEVADYTAPNRKVKTVHIGGVGYQSLMDIKRERRQLLHEPTAKWRRGKDRDVLRRIKDYRG